MRHLARGIACLRSARDSGSGQALTLIVTLTLGTLVASLTAGAQQAAKVPRIGVLVVSTPAATAHLQEAFKQGLREHGYVEGQHIIVERRYGEARAERIGDLAAELRRRLG